MENEVFLMNSLIKIERRKKANTNHTHTDRQTHTNTHGTFLLLSTLFTAAAGLHFQIG